jgi:hypothetical protein
MAFVRLCGWEIPIADKQAGRSTLAMPARAELFGRPRPARRTSRVAWKLKTSLLDPDDAETLEGLASREGWAFPFEADLWSSGGLAPEAGYGATVSGGTATVTTSLTYRPFRHGIPAIRSRWTVLVRRSTTRYAVRSDGAKWVDGTRNDATSTTWLAVALGAVGLDTGSYSELLILPFVASAGAIEAWTAWLADGEAWPRWPHLTADGDLMDAGSMTVLLEPGTTSYHQVMLDSGWQSAARRVEVGMVEIDRAYPWVLTPPPGDPTLWLTAADIDGDESLSDAYADGAIVQTVVNRGTRGAEGNLGPNTVSKGFAFRSGEALGRPFGVLRKVEGAGTFDYLKTVAFASDGAHPVKTAFIGAPTATVSSLTRMWSNRKDTGSYLAFAASSAGTYAVNGSSIVGSSWSLGRFDLSIILNAGGVSGLSVNGVAIGSVAVASNALMDGLVMGVHAGGFGGHGFDWSHFVAWEGSYPSDAEILAWAQSVTRAALPYGP